MRRPFEMKPKATQQTKSAKSGAGRVHSGQNREVRSILYLQRTIGNQAVQRSLQAKTGDLETSSASNASPGFYLGPSTLSFPMLSTRTHKQPAHNYTNRPFFSKKPLAREAAPFFPARSSTPVANVQPKREVSEHQEKELMRHPEHETRPKGLQTDEARAPLPQPGSNSFTKAQLDTAAFFKVATITQPLFTNEGARKPLRSSFFQPRVSRIVKLIIQTRCNTFTGYPAARSKWNRWVRSLPRWNTQTQIKGHFLRIPVTIRIGRKTENAIVYKPKKMTTPTRVDIFLYFHGYNAGYRSSPPHDDYFRFSDQLNKSARHLPNLIGVLPQGARPNLRYKPTRTRGQCSVTARHSFKHYAYNMNTYLQQILQAINLGNASRGKMIVSGHSGGEYPIRKGMAIGRRRRPGRVIPGSWQLGTSPQMVILFDAINKGSEGVWLRQLYMWIHKDLKQLNKIWQKRSAPISEKRKKMLTYLKTSFKFKAYYGAYGSYAPRHKKLARKTQRFIDRKTRTMFNVPARTTVRNQLKTNYRFVPIRTTHKLIGGGGRTTKRPLMEALKNL